MEISGELGLKALCFLALEYIPTTDDFRVMAERINATLLHSFGGKMAFFRHYNQRAIAFKGYLVYRRPDERYMVQFSIEGVLGINRDGSFRVGRSTISSTYEGYSKTRVA